MTQIPKALPIPTGRSVGGTAGQPFEAVMPLDELAPGQMLRVTHGDLDILVAHTSSGLVATEDRCPHMSAPLSLGRLDGCLIGCPLHSARFDLCTGEAVVFPTTGGLDADGMYHPPWTPHGNTRKPEPNDLKAQARAATRVRRMRYFPLRLREGRIEVRLPSSLASFEVGASPDLPR